MQSKPNPTKDTQPQKEATRYNAFQRDAAHRNATRHKTPRPRPARWPGGLGKTATHAVVMARLMLPDGASGRIEDRGPHAFIVQVGSWRGGAGAARDRACARFASNALRGSRACACRAPASAGAVTGASPASQQKAPSSKTRKRKRAPRHPSAPPPPHPAALPRHTPPPARRDRGRHRPQVWLQRRGQRLPAPRPRPHPWVDPFC